MPATVNRRFTEALGKVIFYLSVEVGNPKFLVAVMCSNALLNSFLFPVAADYNDYRRDLQVVISDNWEQETDLLK